MKAIRRFRLLLLRIRSNSSGNLPVISPSLTEGMKDTSLGVDIAALLAQRRDLQDEQGRGSPLLDATDREPLLLGIGTSSQEAEYAHKDSPTVVADSPTAVDFNVYDRAYEDAVKKGMKAGAVQPPTMYLTRFVKEKGQFKDMANLVDGVMDVSQQAIGAGGDGGMKSKPEGGKMAELVSELNVSGSGEGVK